MIDTKDSFLHDYVSDLIKNLKKRGHTVGFITNSENISQGDCLFLLGCSKILTIEQLAFNKHNIVLHPSKLPEGRGSAALVWKILEGANSVYITLFEAIEKVDTGSYYYQEKIVFEGHELSGEIRSKQAMKIMDLVLKFIDDYADIKLIEQKGKSTFYRRRKPVDSKLDINKSIKEQFNLLRVIDNERYPGFFIYKGHKYILKIFDEGKI